MKKKKNPHRVKTSIYCTPSEWEHIRTLAAAAGMSEADYLMARALEDDPGTAPATGLTAPGQAAFADDVRWLCDTLAEAVPEGEGSAGAVTPEEAVRFLVADALDERARQASDAAEAASRP